MATAFACFPFLDSEGETHPSYPCAPWRACLASSSWRDYCLSHCCCPLPKHNAQAPCDHRCGRSHPFFYASPGPISQAPSPFFLSELLAHHLSHSGACDAHCAQAPHPRGLYDLHVHLLVPGLLSWSPLPGPLPLASDWRSSGAPPGLLDLLVLQEQRRGRPALPPGAPSLAAWGAPAQAPQVASEGLTWTSRRLGTAPRCSMHRCCPLLASATKACQPPCPQ
mmetsp:Transcript_48167/g.114528  ORF Transcript_48167/g.114528 Transcript_48167/m.114528 type:complete len:223 (-) Transcript_48167:97-765(-)